MADFNIKSASIITDLLSQSYAYYAVCTEIQAKDLHKLTPAQYKITEPDMRHLLVRYGPADGPVIMSRLTVVMNDASDVHTMNKMKDQISSLGYFIVAAKPLNEPAFTAAVKDLASVDLITLESALGGAKFSTFNLAQQRGLFIEICYDRLVDVNSSMQQKQYLVNTIKFAYRTSRRRGLVISSCAGLSENLLQPEKVAKLLEEYADLPVRMSTKYLQDNPREVLLHAYMRNFTYKATVALID
ncbi:hypothetical protein MP228_000567 [Amoeboaphelidium protococcarum]|nr:hypothetical protein MP228_000567 [Amoeboaphelidium protococcarum]